MLLCSDNNKLKKWRRARPRKNRKLAPKLTPETQQLLKQSVSKSTFTAYKKKWKQFRKYCGKLHVKALPAPPEILASFIAELSKSRQLTTIKTYISAINFFHHKSNLEPPSGYPIIKQILKAISKSPKTTIVHRKPIRQKELLAIIPKIDTNYPKDEATLFKAAISLQFHACLRVGEIAISNSDKHTLRMGQLQAKKKKLIITFKSYKHKDCASDTLEVRRLPAKLKTICPVRLYKEYLKQKFSPIKSFIFENNKFLTVI